MGEFQTSPLSNLKPIEYELFKDERTGLLYEDPSLPASLTLILKEKSIELLAKHFPDIGFVCHELGISRSQFDRHYRMDPVYRARIKDVESDMTDQVEGELLKAAKGKSFLDRIAWLRAHRPEKYNDTRIIKVDRYDSTPERSRAKEELMRSAIDAELVEPRTLRHVLGAESPATGVKAQEHQQGGTGVKAPGPVSEGGGAGGLEPGRSGEGGGKP